MLLVCPTTGHSTTQMAIGQELAVEDTQTATRETITTATLFQLLDFLKEVHLSHAHSRENIF